MPALNPYGRERYSREYAIQNGLRALKLPRVHELEFVFAWGEMGCSVAHNADTSGDTMLMSHPHFGPTYQGNPAGDKQRFNTMMVTARKILELVSRANKCEALNDPQAQLVSDVHRDLVFAFAKTFLQSLPNKGIGQRTITGDEIMNFVSEWQWKRMGGTI